MHLTLKLDTAMPPCSSMGAQRRAFDHFRREYNELRPHEALGNRAPADFCARSKCMLAAPSWGRDFSYPDDFELIRLRKPGTLRRKGGLRRE